MKIHLFQDPHVFLHRSRGLPLLSSRLRSGAGYSDTGTPGLVLPAVLLDEVLTELKRKILTDEMRLGDSRGWKIWWFHGKTRVV
jgi:hypothetical protein